MTATTFPFRIAGLVGGLCAAISAGVSFPASAEPFRDAKTGLAVAPPAGYELKKMTPQGKNVVRVSLKRPEERDTGCQVGYANAPQNAKYPQTEINALMKTKEHQELAKASIGVLYETSSIAPFDHDGVTGLEIVADIKPREGFPARSQEIRSLMILLETPKGRTSVVCVADRTDFSTRRGEFHTLARTVTLPR